MRVIRGRKPTATFEQVLAISCCNAQPQAIAALISIENGECQKVGASWEGFVIDQIVQRLGARSDEVHFWRTHTGAELDLLVIRGAQRLGFEVKRTVAPTITPSMRFALADLQLKSLTVIHAGYNSFMLSKDIHAISARDLTEKLRPLR
jgi:predicted AAA+ superfamily ATPase